MSEIAPETPESSGSTEQSLLEAAIELYGRFGTQAVSLNQIRKHAEVANEAAIRYYFRNKQGLLSRSLDHVAARLLPGLNALAERLESAESEPQVRSILMHFGMPFASLYEVDKNSVSFLGALIHEEGEEGQRLLAEVFGPTILRYEKLLARALPDKAPEQIHVHFFLAINLLIHGLSDIGILRFMPSVSQQPKEHFVRAEILVSAFLSFVQAGVCVNDSSAEQEDGLGSLLASLLSDSP